ncbi:MAG: hypothetical protein ACP5G6_01395 [Conexivisphaera sp.]
MPCATELVNVVELYITYTFRRHEKVLPAPAASSWIRYLEIFRSSPSLHTA